MKTPIEQQLQDSPARPRRPLSADFTQTILAKLDGHQAHKPERRPKWKEYIQVKLIHKPALAATAFAVALTLGGSAYAAVGGMSGVRALFGGETATKDGRIVRVNTKGCPHVNAFNITDPSRSDSDSYYYRIKSDSKLTNQQVVTMVQGYCEADLEAIVNGYIATDTADLPQNKDKLVGGYSGVITAINPTSISIRSDMPYFNNDDLTIHTLNQTYPVDPDVTVINKGAKEDYSTLKVGDHIAITYRATGDALTHSESIRPDQVDASKQTVVIVTRLSEAMRQYYDFGKYNHKEFEQVAPCDSNSSGYCSLAEYQSHKH